MSNNLCQFFNPEKIEKLVGRFESGEVPLSRIWTLVILSNWLKYDKDRP